MASQASKRERDDDETTHSSTLAADGPDPRHVEVMDVVMQEPDAPGLYPPSVMVDG